MTGDARTPPRSGSPDAPLPKGSGLNGRRDRSFSVRFPLLLGGVTLLILLAGFGSWSALTRIAGAIVAPGQLEVERNRQVVQHPEGGVVEAVLVAEGQRVEAGEVLVRLAPDALGSDLAIVEGQLFELMARHARLEAERDGLRHLVPPPLLAEAATRQPEVADLLSGQERLLVARRGAQLQQVSQVHERVQQVNSQIAGIAAQSQALDTQLTLIAQELATQRVLLGKGLSQVARVQALQREEARLRGAIGDLTAQKAQAEGRITEIGLDLLKLETERQESAITTLRDLTYREMELAERRRALRARLDKLQITAPVAGLVYDLSVFAPQSVLRPAEPLMYLVPQDRPLVIAAQVEPIHIDALHLEQEVMLRFPAFDRRTTPELAGHLTRISADAFRDEATGRTYFRVEIRLDEAALAKLPAGLTLLPGMPVEAYLRTEDRTPLAYLLKPLTDYFAKAMREG
ncbi:HlyD family type I secretion periplasmic adaptor subunit [Puniceibacterium sp. HSS470]|nr:HlyD family type I secretion periplasmic adaptor subunit [Puniceibacterium sp. HSS470]